MPSDALEQQNITCICSIKNNQIDTEMKPLDVCKRSYNLEQKKELKLKLLFIFLSYQSLSFLSLP